MALKCYRAWRSMEELYEYGNIHVMDISNFSEDSDFLILNTEIVLR
ncbi:hypothetical protein [Streptococcus porcorum]|uniref:Diketogulonate reductase-like aldo/keto reductase n=1 Tax=Streptococcus porcorum TaxID=701526 RepID=A0ABV2JFX5_9STRE